MTEVSLYMPQWQGSSRPEGLREGACLLFDQLKAQRGFHPIEIDTGECQREGGIQGLSAIRRHIERASAYLKAEKPDRVFTLGGDCGVDVASIHYLNKRYGEKLAVLWFDGHADIHVPETSPSGAFHGMPVRVLLGEGEPSLTKLIKAPLRSGQIVYVGPRSIDPEESAYLHERHIPLFPAHFINQGGWVLLVEMLQRMKRECLHIHLDLDVLDPVERVEVGLPEPDGIRYGALKETLTALRGTFPIVGFTVTEYAATDPHPASLGKVMHLVEPMLHALAQEKEKAAEAA